MKRALLFLACALFCALIVQPNIQRQLQTNSRIPENTTSNPTTNDNANIAQSKSKATICIDAGNGGDDAGYTVSDRIPEKDINLAIALDLGKNLTDFGYNVVYTRTNDDIASYENESDSSKERITFAKENNANYFISITLNYDENTFSKGYSLFTQPDDQMIDLANEISERLKSINYSQFEGLDSDHYSNFPILVDQDLPSLLIELGYISNLDDYNSLTDEQFQQSIGRQIALAILEIID